MEVDFMYKVGDEVLIRGEITDVHEGTDNPYFVAHKHGYINWVSEDKIIPMDKTYADGLNDAWELAKKLADMKHEDFKEIFDKNGLYTVIFNYSYEEALAKIEAYEKKNEIKVGDVVKGSSGNNAVVIHVDNDSGLYFMVYGDGLSCRADKKYLEKTGKHIDIESLLKQIGE